MDDDLVVLEVVKGPTPAHVLPLAKCPIASVVDAKVWVVTWGLAMVGKLSPRCFTPGTYLQFLPVDSYTNRHFVYATPAGRKDAGGAVVNDRGELVGLHLGGWGGSTPLPLLPVTRSAGAAGGAGGTDGTSDAAGGKEDAAAANDLRRAVAMGIADMEMDTQESVLELASRLLVIGGYAVYMGSAPIAALCSTEWTGSTPDCGSPSMAAATAAISAAVAGTKRKGAEGDNSAAKRPADAAC